MISKMQVFIMLPVLLMGTVPAIHKALIKIVHGIILLNGRVISERVRRNKGSAMYACAVVYWSSKHLPWCVMCRYKTCFNHVRARDIVVAELILTEGMSEYAKATPPSLNKSHMHHVVHYPRCVNLFGPLNGCTMLSDERRNKVLLVS